MIWRNIFFVRENFLFFHTLCVTLLWQKFRESNIRVFPKITKYVVELTNFYCDNEFFIHSVPQCGNYGNLYSHSFFKFFVKVMVLLFNWIIYKIVDLTEVFSVRVNFSFFQLPQSGVGKWKIYSFSCRNFFSSNQLHI